LMTNNVIRAGKETKPPVPVVGVGEGVKGAKRWDGAVIKLGQSGSRARTVGWGGNDKIGEISRYPKLRGGYRRTNGCRSA